MTQPASIIDGQWQLIRAEHAGEEAPDMVTEKMTIELAHGAYMVRFGGKVVDSGTFEVGGVVDSYTVILHGSVGPNAGRTIPCIFQLRGDRLRMCYGFDGRAPTEYTTNATNQRYMATYRRM
jgi:uncharacterized protein (TIGR03067 family)